MITPKEFKIYIAGPHLFFSDAKSRYDNIKKMFNNFSTHDFKFTGISPIDAGLTESVDVNPLINLRMKASSIRKHNLKLIKQCHAVIADLSNFPFLDPDIGTVYEIGYADALGKVVAFTRSQYFNNYDDYVNIVRHKVTKFVGDKSHEIKGHWGDESTFTQEFYDQTTVENFNLPLNLMIDHHRLFQYLSDTVIYITDKLKQDFINSLIPPNFEFNQE